ncbi:hypothetical protein ACH419_39530 [Streptomyces bobili]|uniref:hypothetical protein n=1 Tax=Streptomyces bobili TaxID=67280 RepID=UPI0037A156F4
MSARERLQVMVRTERGDMNVYSQPEVRAALDAHRAEVLAGDGQAYDGELAMLRGLVRTLRVVVREDNNVAEVRRLLHQHAADEAAAYAETGDSDRARQAALLVGILAAPARRWKSGRAVNVLREAGYHPISPSTASHDLGALAAAGHLIRHEESGVVWYEIARRSGGVPRG